MREDDPETAVASLRDWGERLAHAGWERLGPSQQRRETPAEAWRRLRLAMLSAERDVVVEMRRRGEVPPDVVDDVLERLDQEEAMLVGFAGSAPAADPGEEPVTADGECDHLRVAPSGTEPNLLDACEDCLAIEDPSWVHLRACLTCGHTACCDSSPNRHATAHYTRTGHPVMRSVEEGEAWRWCYVDGLAG
jgi:CPA1 family monovalent cation:H+ antiporter